MTGLQETIRNQSRSGESFLSVAFQSRISSAKSSALFVVSVSGADRLCAVVGHAGAAKLFDAVYSSLRNVGGAKNQTERLGISKYVILLSDVRNEGHARLAASKIERVIRSIAAAEASAAFLTPFIGTVLCLDGSKGAGELLRQAEIAALCGRRQGVTTSFHKPDAKDSLFRNWEIEKRLGSAIETGELYLNYQPKVECCSGRVAGAEALMRWTDPDFGPISPEVFIDLAESTGAISTLTYFAVQSAARELSAWRKILGNINIAINVTPSIVKSRDIVEVLKNATEIWGVPAECITVEITESALMENKNDSHAVLMAIRELGARISIDDFGTGYSSLAYLKELPADELKIDRSFVMGMLNDRADHKIVQHVINLAKSFDLRVVAEGVETKAQFEAVRDLGCDYAQGYYFCKPTSAEDFLAFAKPLT